MQIEITKFASAEFLKANIETLSVLRTFIPEMNDPDFYFFINGASSVPCAIDEGG